MEAGGCAHRYRVTMKVSSVCRWYDAMLFPLTEAGRSDGDAMQKRTATAIQEHHEADKERNGQECRARSDHSSTAVAMQS